MASPNLFKDDFGFLLTFELGDLSNSTDFVIRIAKPIVNKQRVVVEHSLNQTAILDPVKGIVGYIVAEGDLDKTGSYLVQLSDVTPGRRRTTPEHRFRVKPTLARFQPV